MKVCKAYVDGSYSTKIPGKAGWGCIMQTHTGEILQNSGVLDDQGTRQIAGEIEAAMAAMSTAIQLSADKLTIFYDYEGLPKWANGDWKTKNPVTKRYQDFCYEVESDGLILNFVKVDPAANKADALATAALGIKSVH